MKTLTTVELLQVCGGNVMPSSDSEPSEAKTTSNYEVPGLSQKQWTQIAGMVTSAFITNSKMAAGPQKSAVAIAGFAAANWLCNVGFSLL